MRAFVFLLFLMSAPLFGTLEWSHEYASSVEESRRDHKPLLLFFTGSDWSGCAMQMKNEMLDADTFSEKIATHFHCVEVDFPQHKELPDALLAQNACLKERFGVEETPQLLLLDENEREILRLGYMAESGELLAKELLHAVAQDRELSQGLATLPRDQESLRHLYELSQELRRKEAGALILAAGVEREEPFFLLEQYRSEVEEGREATALRATLLATDDQELHFSVAMIDFQARAANLRDPAEVIKPLEAYLTRFGGEDTENVWRIEMMIAQFYLDADEWRSALKHAETAYEAAPGHFRDEIEGSLTYIRDQIR